MSTSEPLGPDAAGAWSPDGEDSALAAAALSIPGMEGRPDGCGDWLPLEFCAECGEPQMRETRCERRVCPECWGRWSRLAAKRIVERLASARLAAPKGRERRAVHVVVSPPEGEISTIAQMDRARRRAYDLLKEHGVRGGVVVPHGYRLTEAAKREFRVQDRYASAWQYVREVYGEDWQDAVYFSPHFHALGLAEDVAPNAPEADDGWVVERIRSFDHIRGAYDVEPFEDMAFAALYLLSHVSFDPAEEKHTAYWYGALSNSTFSPGEEHSEGLLNAIERKAEEATGGERFRQVEPNECEEDGCTGTCTSMREVGRYLSRPSWVEGVVPETEERLRGAWDWFVGASHPPPGLRHPKTREHAEEALAGIVEGGD